MAEEAKMVPKLRFKGFSEPWRQEELGKIATTFSGGTPKVSNKEYYQGKIPFIRSAEVNSATTELFISESALGNSSAKLVTKGTILYALYGATSGEVGIAKLDGAINQAILAIIPNRKNDVNFLYQDLKMMQNKIVNKYLQGGQGNLSGSIVQKIPIKFPPYAEQNKVGIFLSQLDNLITLHEEKLSHLETLKRGMLQELFPDKGDVMPVLRHETFKGIWKQSKLSEISENHIGGGTPSTNKKENWTGNIPWIQSSSLNENELWNVNIDKHISEQALENSPAKIIPKNSIAVVTRVGVGKLALIKQDYTTSQDFLSLVNINGDLQFITLSLYIQLQKIVHKLQGTSIKGITSKELLNQSLKIPEVSEQKKIGSILKMIDDSIELHEKKLSQLQKTKKFLLQNLFI